MRLQALSDRNSAQGAVMLTASKICAQILSTPSITSNGNCLPRLSLTKRKTREVITLRRRFIIRISYINRQFKPNHIEQHRSYPKKHPATLITSPMSDTAMATSEMRVAILYA